MFIRPVPMLEEIPVLKRDPSRVVRRGAKIKKEARKRQSAKIVGGMVYKRGTDLIYPQHMDTQNILMDGDAIAAGGYFNGKEFVPREPVVFRKLNSHSVAEVLFRLHKGQIRLSTAQRYLRKIAADSLQVSAVTKIIDSATYMYRVEKLVEVDGYRTQYDEKKYLSRRARKMPEWRVRATHIGLFEAGIREEDASPGQRERALLVGLEIVEAEERKKFVRTIPCRTMDWVPLKTFSTEEEARHFYNLKAIVEGPDSFRVVARVSFTDKAGPRGLDYIMFGKGEVAGTDRPDYTSPLVKRGVSADKYDGWKGSHHQGSEENR